MYTDDPKTEWQLLEMFEVLAGEYFAAKDALDFPGLHEVIAADKDPRTYWLQQMQSMMLRKFFAPSDSIQLPKVCRALRACAVPEAAADVNQVAGWIEWQFEQAKSEESASFNRLLSEGGDDAFDDMVYGRLLHANSAKFLRTQAMPGNARAVALFVGSADVQKALHLATCNIAICRTNGWLMDQGALVPPPMVQPKQKRPRTD